LSKTKIIGEGLKYLKPHKKWTWVYLEGCDHLNPSFLAHFSGWRRSTITVGKKCLRRRRRLSVMAEMKKFVERKYANLRLGGTVK